jgi:tight adherence protein C
MANLEIRAGRSMTEALEHLGDRLGLEEARSFATLVQQSAELGSSITEALRVYSDDMRHKRLSRAEEKAYSLPAKLAVPMMVCIFPVLFVVILRAPLHRPLLSTRPYLFWRALIASAMILILVLVASFRI